MNANGAADPSAIADEAIRARLAEFGAAAEPMPADVVARLDAALRAQPLSLAVRPGRPTPVTPAGSPFRERRRPAPSRRWLIASTVVIVLVVLGGGAVAVTRWANSVDTEQTSFARGDSASETTGQSLAERPESAAKGAAPERQDGAAPGALAAPSLRVSGTDYAEQSLIELTTRAALPTGAPALSAADLARVPAALRRLAAPSALLACASAAGASGQISADFASFRGTPALIFVSEAPGGIRNAIAVGPSCAPGMPDVRFSYRNPQ